MIEGRTDKKKKMSKREVNFEKRGRRRSKELKSKRTKTAETKICPLEGEENLPPHLLKKGEKKFLSHKDFDDPLS